MSCFHPVFPSPVIPSHLCWARLCGLHHPPSTPWIFPLCPQEQQSTFVWPWKLCTQFMPGPTGTTCNLPHWNSIKHSPSSDFCQPWGDAAWDGRFLWHHNKALPKRKAPRVHHLHFPQLIWKYFFVIIRAFIFISSSCSPGLFSDQWVLSPSFCSLFYYTV